MNITINSRILGTITFFLSESSGYIWANTNGQSGTLGNQICERGEFSGPTLTTYPAVFEKTCKKWVRNRIERLNKY